MLFTGTLIAGGVIKLAYGHILPLFAKWYAHGSAFHVWVKYIPSPITGQTTLL